MSIGLAYSDRFLEHETGPDHPERPQRLTALLDALEADGLLDRMERLPFEAIRLEALQALHDPLYLDQLRDAFADGVRYLDDDTPISAASYEVATLAAGAAVAAADAVMAGEVSRAFCAVRPPGHHAEHDRAMGFCLLNNVALAANHLIRRHGLSRVAIVDFDVHHGNGTQHMFEERGDVLFISLHQDPRTLFPGTGFAHETGRGPGEGFTLNVPMPPGAGDGAYHQAFERKVLPALRGYEPEAVLISAGFDAAAEDPLGQIELSADGFAQITRHVVKIADKFADGRLISVLEGGYDLQALGACGAAHIASLF